MHNYFLFPATGFQQRISFVKFLSNNFIRLPSAFSAHIKYRIVIGELRKRNVVDRCVLSSDKNHATNNNTLKQNLHQHFTYYPCRLAHNQNKSENNIWIVV